MLALASPDYLLVCYVSVSELGEDEGFKPRFGSDLGIAIINELGDLKNLLTLEEASRARRKELNRIEKEKSKRRDAIEKMRVHLLWQIEVRKKELSELSSELSTS